MRVFTDLSSATDEIIRDLTKSPRVHSSRVQHLAVDKTAHEAMNYAYTILPGGIPELPEDVMGIARDFFPFYRNPDHCRDVAHWMTFQRSERLQPLSLGHSMAIQSDQYHPVLKDLKEGGTWAYLYRDRLLGAVETMSYTLECNPDSRRAYWPIFREMDGLRAFQMTRIPCSIGYHAVIREQPGIGDQLHLTYLQRSADVEIFWITDVWLAYQFQKAVANRLKLPVGNFSHIILSFHAFEREEEIY